ncbi:MAG: peptidoglycan-associated lipoprotein Pal [Hydrogenophilaceae bacterium]|nr:peptidoglycan-associated lipoprotein Pal [Hydrogenophilaceae bacterium]
MKYAIHGVVLAVLLAGCAQEPSKEAKIEDRSAAAQAAGAQSTVQTQGLAGADTSGQALDAGNLAAPPKNAAGALGQRVIYFDYDSAAIRSEYRAVLEAHAGFVKANARAKANLEGHADERGSPEYNIALGQRRADSVRKAMQVLGAADGRMEAVSFGEEKPAVQGHDESAWSKNRRVEIRYDGE